MKFIQNILESIKKFFTTKPVNELEDYLSKSVDRTDYKRRLDIAKRRGLL